MLFVSATAPAATRDWDEPNGPGFCAPEACPCLRCGQHQTPSREPEVAGFPCRSRACPLQPVLEQASWPGLQAAVPRPASPKCLQGLPEAVQAVLVLHSSVLTTLVLACRLPSKIGQAMRSLQAPMLSQLWCVAGDSKDRAGGGGWHQHQSAAC